MIAYDATNKRLGMFTREATPEFWDEQWNKEELLKNITSGNTHHFLKRMTMKYVPAGGRILEGGCGTGQVVYAMDTWGYKAQGIDYAKRTIETVKELVPELRVQIGDVRQLPFADDTFDGYWSLGVIEHFWDGFDEITKEARRILKPGGVFFLSFPVMSPLRKLKARLNRYESLPTPTPDGFYEFMLDQDLVAHQVAKEGFELVETYLYDAVKGMKDELPALRPMLQRLYKSKRPLARGIRLLLTLLVGRFAGHMTLLVLRKTN